jgi:O-succinylbenzoic acid--CoA ligase
MAGRTLDRAPRPGRTLRPVAELVVLSLPAGPAFVAALQRVWATGDAAFPLDQRLPPPAARSVLDALAPSAVVEADGERRRLPGGRPVEDGDAVVVATSGTTGQPKGVVLTSDAVRASAEATTARVGADPDRDRWLACLPLAHIGGLAVVLRALVTGVPLTVHDGFDPAAVTQAAEVGGATLTSLVYRALDQIDAALFRRILAGGSAPPGPRPPNVWATYGMTETGSGIAYEGLPLEGVDVEVDDQDQIRVRGPMLLRAYRDGTDPRDADGWLATGDLGRIGPDGRLEVWGRAGDVVVTGGEKVWPEPVERRLRQHPQVSDVAIVGRRDPDWGHRVVAVVVPVDPSRPPALPALREWVRAELPVWCAPRELVVARSLPRTALGKLRRADLAATPPA